VIDGVATVDESVITDTKMSGVDIDGRELRKGATDSIVAFVKQQGGRIPAEISEMSDRIARMGGTPLAVADGAMRSFMPTLTMSFRWMIPSIIGHPRLSSVNMTPHASVTELIARHTEGRTLGVLGEPRVNVLEVNLALDDQFGRR
jgi:hypothetical protein